MLSYVVRRHQLLFVFLYTYFRFEVFKYDTSTYLRRYVSLLAFIKTPLSH
jgi:hypothetical protein